MFTLPGVLLFPSTSDVLHYSRDYSFSEQFNSSKLTQTCARAYLAKFRSRDIRRNARFNTQRNAFDSARARRQCEFVRICCVISRRTPRRQTMLMRRLSPLYHFLASGLSLCSLPGLLIPQGIQSPNARIRLARVTRRTTRISSPNQAEGVFSSEEIAIFVCDVGIENCHFFYPAREMCFSKRQRKKFPDNIINFNLFNRTSVRANIVLL